ncbi:uncharacterized protein I206_102367 [Kwoniella pini CBS 10737]|uniref:Uncharacterized protein n=1 Tax=Kwoniella pini CBS 10737 TaxID=1296096 RepID=A0A1B9I564_9TREE|nr:uncharacterized protein I206_02714 [Kwoniella pini CBS 10737]OCF50659.1 hypothetical protein I206_02714 [Kwoniella pini CBS 10737]
MTSRSALRPLQSCLKCNRSSFISHRKISTSIQRNNSDTQEGKINKWFINENNQQSHISSSSSSSSSLDSNSSNSINNISFSFDNMNSNQNLDETIQIIPNNIPKNIYPIYKFLIEPKNEASEVLLQNTIKIYDNSNLLKKLELKGQGELIKSNENENENSNNENGSWYNWIIVIQVKGNGRNTISRADGVIRRWLLKNPLHPSIIASPFEYPKTPRISPDSDWSIIPLNLGPNSGIRVCINLINEQGKERWKLDELFSKGI